MPHVKKQVDLKQKICFTTIYAINLRKKNHQKTHMHEKIWTNNSNVPKPNGTKQLLKHEAVTLERSGS